MKNDRSIYRDMKMLDDEEFILWCLNLTKELDRQLVSSIRLNDDKMPEDERRQLQARILRDLRKEQE